MDIEFEIRKLVPHFTRPKEIDLGERFDKIVRIPHLTKVKFTRRQINGSHANFVPGKSSSMYQGCNINIHLLNGVENI